MRALLLSLAILSITTSTASAAPPENCQEMVRSTLKDRLNKLRQENKLPLSEDFLYSDPRFRNFPALGWQMQINWCPKLEVLEMVDDFLVEVGFRRERMEDYFKYFSFLSEDPAIKKELAVREYQVGNTWSRPRLELADTKKPGLGNLFFSYATALLEVDKRAYISGAIYLGTIAGHEVVTLPYHTLTLAQADSKVYRCEDVKFIFPGIKENPVVGRATLAILPEADLALCEVSTIGLTSKLQPLEFSWSTPLPKDTALATLGRGQYSNPEGKITYDISDECRTLADESEASLDVNPGYPSSWRLAMGCDISHGDSGGAVIARETGQWVGFVTSTKNYTFQSRAGAAFDGTLKGEELLRETSHLMPLSKIKAIIEMRLKDSDVSEDERRVLIALLNHDRAA